MKKQDEYRNVCDNIRYLRTVYGLSRTAMARKLRITVKTLDSLEAGVFPKRIGIHFFSQVEQIFGIHPVQMLDARLGESGKPAEAFTPEEKSLLG